MSYNVYADIGFPDAENMLLKAGLVVELSDSIATRGMSLTGAARLLGIPRGSLRAMLEGQFDDVSVGEITDFLSRINAAPQRRLPAMRRHRAQPHLT